MTRRHTACFAIFSALLLLAACGEEPSTAPPSSGGWPPSTPTTPSNPDPGTPPVNNPTDPGTPSTPTDPPTTPPSGTCSPANCGGCCDGDRCMPGVSETSCGRNGAVCQLCSGGDTCSAGVCEAPATPPTNPSNPPSTPPANKVYTVRLQSTKLSNAAELLCKVYPPPITFPVPWIDLCDLFVETEVNGNKVATAEKSNQMWGKLVAWGDTLGSGNASDLAAGIKIRVYDADPFTNQMLSECTVAPTQADLDAGSLEVSCTGTTTTTVTLLFEAQ